MESKNLFKSKTFWLNAISIALPVAVPMAQQLIVQHPAAAAGLVGALNILNRIVGTSGPVTVLPQ